MSLYDDVVLAVTAAGGYKEGKIYSVKPDGLGDYPYFTVVRATTPNRINKDGDTEVVSINTPVIDWTTGSPLLIVSEVGEITLTTPSNATKVVITINGVDTEYNNVFPTLVLPVGSISKIIATDGGVVYDLLRDYLIRITEATIYAPQNLYKTEQGSRDLKAVYEFLDDEGLLAGTELLFLSNAGLVLRTENGLQYIAKGFDASENDNDLVNNTGTAQPRLVGGIAPNSKPAAANQSGESRSFSHTSITVSGTYTTVKMMDTGGKYEFTYTEVTSGTLSTVTWTGNLRIYMIYAGTLSASERTSLETQLYSLYPEIESVDIGTQTWATRNFEAVATPLGNVIANVTGNGAVEKISGGDFEGGLVGNILDLGTGQAASWSLNTTDPISGTQDGLLNISVAGSMANRPVFRFFNPSTGITVGRYYKLQFDYKVKSGNPRISSIFNGGLKAINFAFTGEGTFTIYEKCSSQTSFLYLYFLNTVSELQIDNVSVQELGWANATEIYDAVYAATAGTAEQKEYAALKEAAMWCYYNNSADNGAIYGKLYNWYAAKLLDLDMQTAGFGWRVPSKSNYDTLNSVAGNSGIKMTSPYWNGNNLSGWTALPNGFRQVNGVFYAPPTAFSGFKTRDEFTIDKSTIYFGNSYSANLGAGTGLLVEGGAIRLIKST